MTTDHRTTDPGFRICGLVVSWSPRAVVSWSRWAELMAQTRDRQAAVAFLQRIKSGEVAVPG
jgi:hypothetical protein